MREKVADKSNFMHFLDWCSLEACLVWIYIWQIDYFFQIVTLFLVLSCRKIASEFCEAIFALAMQKKDLNSGKLIALPAMRQILELWNSNLNKYVKMSTQWDTRLRSVSIIWRNRIVTDFSGNHLMMPDSPKLISQFIMLQNYRQEMDHII